MKRIRGQSDAAQRARLDRACCPVHGLFMSQVTGWFGIEGHEQFTVVACPRHDCAIRGKSVGYDGPVTLISHEEATALEVQDQTRFDALLKVSLAAREARMGKEARHE